MTTSPRTRSVLLAFAMAAGFALLSPAENAPAACCTTAPAAEATATCCPGETRPATCCQTEAAKTGACCQGEAKTAACCQGEAKPAACCNGTEGTEAACCATTTGEPCSVQARAAFDLLKSLAGDWRGTIGTADGPQGAVRYEVTAGGSVVVETLFPGTPHEMVSMYHLDGGALVATHYCAAGNQPRFRLVGMEGSRLSFGFHGGSNLDPAVSTHIHGGSIHLQENGELHAEWIVLQNGQELARHRFFLSRVASGSN